MKIAFFDAKSYDKVSFDKYGNDNGIKFKYFETKLNEDTVGLAKGYDCICAFVNDILDETVINILKQNGKDAQRIRNAVIKCFGLDDNNLNSLKTEIQQAKKNNTPK